MHLGFCIRRKLDSLKQPANPLLVKNRSVETAANGF
jgi:hypothetical protein